MKTKTVILYYVEEDGVYSAVFKREVSQAFADEVLNARYRIYFKTFGEAKKRLTKIIQFQFDYWREALNGAKKLTSKDIKAYS